MGYGAHSIIGIDARKLGDFGIGTYVRHLLAHPPADCELHAFTAPCAPALPEQIHAHTISAKSYSLGELLVFRQLVQRWGLSLLHVPHYVVPFGLPSTCRVVVTIHDLIHLRFPEYLTGPHQRAYAMFMLRRAVRRADVVLTVSEASRQDIIERLGAAPDSVVAIPNGVDPAFRPGSPEPMHPRPYLLFVGNMMPHKNVGLLLDAFELLRKRGTDVDLVCVGGNPERTPGLAERFTRHLFRKSIRLVPTKVPQDELIRWYQGARAVVLPTRYEGFGLPALEALACGVPVVAARVGALAEVLGELGIFFDDNVAEECADALERCLSDAGHASRIRNAGPDRAKTFPWSRTAEATHEVYRRLLENRPVS